MINIQTESLWKTYTENSSATKIPENTFKHLLTDCTANAGKIFGLQLWRMGQTENDIGDVSTWFSLFVIVMITGQYWSSTRSISNQYVDSYKASLQTCSAMVMKNFFWMKMVETFSSWETNNSD